MRNCHGNVKGIDLNVHKDCSSLSFFFHVNGILRDPVQMAEETNENEDLPFNFVKTQFASPEIHIIIIKLLRYLKGKYFQRFEVIELLQLDRGSIRVAQYLTELPSKEIFKKKPHDAIRRAKSMLNNKIKMRKSYYGLTGK
jgi:hypothetical protein